VHIRKRAAQFKACRRLWFSMGLATPRIVIAAIAYAEVASDAG